MKFITKAKHNLLVLRKSCMARIYNTGHKSWLSYLYSLIKTFRGEFSVMVSPDVFNWG